MKAGVLVLDTFDFTAAALKKDLSERGYEISAVLFTGGDGFAAAEAYVAATADAVIVCGNTERFVASMRDRYAVTEEIGVFVLENKPYALCPVYDRDRIENVVVPMLNSKCRTFYTTARFQTFGLKPDELKELLKDQIRNRNRIAFDFYPSLDGCEVCLRYSSKTSKESVDETIAAVSEKLKDCTYSFLDESLAETVAALIKVRGKKLCLAESFTGGGIAAALTKIPGASEFLYEGIVCYSPLSKIDRLGVDGRIIDTYGAVSIETVYEMAAGLLMRGNCDVAVATTGNAGPTAEREGDEGHCFIAVGDAKGIHIYEYRFTGTREQVIAHGVNHALFKLYKKLKANPFEELVQQQLEEKNSEKNQ